MAHPNRHFVVVGLGSFGSALALRLTKNGCRVTGLDSAPERVEALKDELYEAVIGDATERETLEHLKLDSKTAVVISLGEDITLSLLATLHAKETGASRVIVKGVSEAHGKLLQRIGVERVIFPELEIAHDLADRLTWPNVLDFIPIDPEYSIAEIAVPTKFVGKTLQQVNLRRSFGVWVVSIKDALTGNLEMFPDGDFALNDDQILLTIGRQDQINRLRDIEE